MIKVQVVYATPSHQYCEDVVAPVGSTAREVIEQSQVLEKFTEIDLSFNKVGVYSRLVQLDAVMDDGDRVEIYRSLKADPKTVRRRLAKEGRTIGRSR